jgi:MFS family permease
LIGLSEVIPAVSLSLYAGHVIDISEKRKLLLRGVALYFLGALFLLGLSTHYTSTQLSNHWIAFSIYVTIFFTGVFRAFTGPTFGTMVASIVPKRIYCRMQLPGTRAPGYPHRYRDMRLLVF